MLRLSSFALALVALAAILAVPTAQADFIELPVKWSQKLDVQTGGGRLSIHGPAGVPTGPVVADDFKSETDDPIVAVRWWGSYLDYSGDPPPGCGSPAGGVPFHIGFYKDVPLGDDEDPDVTWSHPGELLEEFDQIVCAQEEFYGEVPGPQSVFEYNAWLQIPFRQAEYHDPVAGSTIFWIRIDRVGRNDWHWRESYTENIDNAVRGPMHAGPWEPLFKEKKPNVPADMAFELMVVPEPATVDLLAIGGLCLLGYAWRLRKRTA